MKDLEQRRFGYWVWLFPLTFVIHIAEEAWGGEGFYHWASRVRGINFTAVQFWSLVCVAWGLVVLGIFLVRKSSRFHWILPALASMIAINGLSHLRSAILYGTYNPGLVSGLLVWFPLGVYTLWHCWKKLARRTFWGGVVVGMVVIAAVYSTPAFVAGIFG